MSSGQNPPAGSWEQLHPYPVAPHMSPGTASWRFFTQISAWAVGDRRASENGFQEGVRPPSPGPHGDGFVLTRSRPEPDAQPLRWRGQAWGAWVQLARVSRGDRFIPQCLLQVAGECGWN